MNNVFSYKGIDLVVLGPFLATNLGAMACESKRNLRAIPWGSTLFMNVNPRRSKTPSK